MEIEDYKKIVSNNTPKEDYLLNGMISFFVGGLMGVIGQLIFDIYVEFFNISNELAPTYMSVTIIFVGCLLTALGNFDDLVSFCKCGLIIPITGFAHSMQSAALEYKKEGLITGIGSNMFKLAGSVIIYGVVSAYIFGLIRIIWDYI